MQVKQEDKNGVMICQLSGEIDINSAPQMKKRFAKFIGTVSFVTVIPG